MPEKKTSEKTATTAKVTLPELRRSACVDRVAAGLPDEAATVWKEIYRAQPNAAQCTDLENLLRRFGSLLDYEAQRTRARESGSARRHSPKFDPHVVEMGPQSRDPSYVADTYITTLEDQQLSPKRARDRRTSPLAVLQQRLDRVTGEGTCGATIIPLLGVAARCVKPCSRCTALAAEVERLRPEWEPARAQYQKEHPESERAPAPTAVTVDELDA